MNRLGLLLFGLALVVGVLSPELGCNQLQPYPPGFGEDPYDAGTQPQNTSGSGGSGAADGSGATEDAFEGGGGDSAPPLCTGCSLVAMAQDPQSLALDPSLVYWTQGQNSGGTPIAGTGSVDTASRGAPGVPSTLVPSLTGPLIVTVLNTYVAFSTLGASLGTGSIGLVHGSGAATTVAMNLSNAYGVALDAANVYWVSTAGGSIAVQSQPLGGGATSTLGTVTTGLLPTEMAVNGTNIYFGATAPGLGGGNGQVFSLPVTGGTPIPIWTGTATSDPVDVIVDAINVYWTDYGGPAVYAMPLAGGAVQTLASAAGGLLGPFRIAVDSTNVYIADYKGSAIYEVPVGTTTPKKVVASTPSPLGIAADDSDSNIYFTSPTQVLSHPK